MYRYKIFAFQDYFYLMVGAVLNIGILYGIFKRLDSLDDILFALGAAGLISIVLWGYVILRNHGHYRIDVDEEFITVHNLFWASTKIDYSDVKSVFVSQERDYFSKSLVSVYHDVLIIDYEGGDVVLQIEGGQSLVIQELCHVIDNYAQKNRKKKKY